MKAAELAQAFGYLTGAEVDALGELARGLPDRPLVANVGAGAGTSALAFLEARDDLRLWTVDRQVAGSALGGLGSEMEAVRDAGLDDPLRYAQVAGDSAEVGKAWWFQLDLVFVDAGHLEHEARADLGAWIPHVKLGGLVVVHDYGSPDWPGVKAAADDLLDGWELVLAVDTVRAYRCGS